MQQVLPLVHLTFCFNYLLTQKNRKMSTKKFATNALHAGHDVSQNAGGFSIKNYFE